MRWVKTTNRMRKTRLICWSNHAYDYTASTYSDLFALKGCREGCYVLMVTSDHEIPIEIDARVFSRVALSSVHGFRSYVQSYCTRTASSFVTVTRRVYKSNITCQAPIGTKPFASLHSQSMYVLP